MDLMLVIGHILFQVAVVAWGWFLWVRVEDLTDHVKGLSEQLEAARKTVRELVLVTVFNARHRDSPLDDVEAELPWEKAARLQNREKTK